MRFGYQEAIYNFIKDFRTGCIISFAPWSKQVEVYIEDLCLASGVVVGPDDE